MRDASGFVLIRGDEVHAGIERWIVTTSVRI
jgi:hypothetical protein